MIYNALFCVLFIAPLMVSGVMAQEPVSQSPAEEAPAGAGQQSFASARELSNYFESKIQSYFTSIESISGDQELIKAITAKDTGKLESLSGVFQRQLEDSLKVRLYSGEIDTLDFENSPACGYACADMIQSARKGPPSAEALLFKTPDANITLVRAIKDSSGKFIGTIVAHYPYTIIEDVVSRLKDIGLYYEFRQSTNGKYLPLFTSGDKSIKEGSAQRFVRINNTRWSIAIWTPGGIELENYEPPSIPWVQIIIGIAVLLIGIFLLIAYHNKHTRKPQAKKIPKVRLDDAAFLSHEAISTEEGAESERTLVFAGGAAEVDVGAYLKEEDITELKHKIQEDITDLKKRTK